MDIDLYKEHYLDPEKSSAVVEWTQNGGKAIGYFCIKVSVEIIHTAGFFPIRLFGNRQSIKNLTQYFSTYSCYFVKSIFEAALQGKFERLEGQVFSFDCDCMRFLSEIWPKVVRPSYFYFLNNPHSASTAGSETFFTKELQDFWQSLLDYNGRKGKRKDLLEAIHLYNQLRECYRRIEFLRSDAKITGTDAAKLALYGQLVPPVETLKNLTRIILEGNFSTPVKRPRVMVIGSEHPDPEFFHLLESMQAHIIADDCCTFGRTAQPGIQIIDRDPFLSLSHFYLKEQTQCPCMSTKGRFEKRLDDILTKVKKNEIDGVVFAIQRYCDPHQLDYPDLKSALENQGIPNILIELEQAVDTEPIKNRLNAFIEILQ